MNTLGYTWNRNREECAKILANINLVRQVLTQKKTEAIIYLFSQWYSVGLPTVNGERVLDIREKSTQQVTVIDKHAGEKLINRDCFETKANAFDKERVMKNRYFLLNPPGMILVHETIPDHSNTSFREESPNDNEIKLLQNIAYLLQEATNNPHLIEAANTHFHDMAVNILPNTHNQ